jgi:hypothetical protein
MRQCLCETMVTTPALASAPCPRETHRSGKVTAHAATITTPAFASAPCPCKAMVTTPALAHAKPWSPPLRWPMQSHGHHPCVGPCKAMVTTPALASAPCPCEADRR